MRRELFLTIFTISVFTVLSSVLICYVNADRSLSRVKGRGIIDIGYAVEAPYAFITSDGSISGIYPEVAKIIAKKAGLPEIRWHLCEFGSLIPGLEAERFDVIAAGLFITPERMELISFSIPVMKVSQGLLVRKGNPLGLNSYAGFRERESVKVAVLSGSIEEAFFRELEIPEGKIISVPDTSAGIMTVESGLSNGFALSAPSIDWMVKSGQLHRSGKAVPFRQPVSRSGLVTHDSAFAFRKKDRRLLEEWDRRLSEFLKSREYPALLEQFGLSEAENSLNTGGKTQ